MVDKDNDCVMLDAESVEKVKDLLHDVIDDLSEAQENDYHNLAEGDYELYDAIVNACGLIVQPKEEKVD